MKIDERSPTWAAVKAAAEAKIEDFKNRLEKHLPEHDTTVLRAQIKAWREVLSLPIADRKSRSVETDNE